MDNHLIIMAGGIGSRFWPMSTPQKPKQFLDILGVGRSLLQLTVDRFAENIPKQNIWVVTSQDYKNIVLEQLPFICEDNVLLEPCMRNTAPCIAYAVSKIKLKYPKANLVVSPADHIVLDNKEFNCIVADALSYVNDNKDILTLGMKPSRPETGYGYIHAQENNLKIKKVLEFKEKPNVQIAKEYLKNENYLWNAGIFFWSLETIDEILNMHIPETMSIFKNIEKSFYTDEEQKNVNKFFPLCKSISIDYAVLENSDNIVVYPASFAWSDLGTWGSLYANLNKDENNNAIVGENVKMIDSNNCVVNIDNNKKYVIQGLQNYIIAEYNNTTLICKKEEEQRIKEFSQ